MYFQPCCLIRPISALIQYSIFFLAFRSILSTKLEVKYYTIVYFLLVIVHGKPGKPGGVSATNLDSQSGKVVWTDGTIYGAEIESYRIEGRTNHNMTWVVLADRVR